MKQKLPERRRFIRIETPLNVEVIDGDRVFQVVTKNISPVGLRFEVGHQISLDKMLDLSLFLPELNEPISLKAKPIWQQKTSLEDNAPYDVGIEIIEIKDSDKNIFLKYICDFLYKSHYEART